MARIPWARDDALDAHAVLTRLRSQVGEDTTELLAVIDRRLSLALSKWAETGSENWTSLTDVLYIARGQLAFHMHACKLVTVLPEHQAAIAARIIDEERAVARGHHDWSWALLRVAWRVVDEVVSNELDGNLE